MILQPALTLQAFLTIMAAPILLFLAVVAWAARSRHWRWLGIEGAALFGLFTLGAMVAGSLHMVDMKQRMVDMKQRQVMAETRQMTQRALALAQAETAKRH